MRYLIDSHALIWWWNQDAGLSPRARDEMSSGSNTLFVSAVSAWELATKYRSGRLPSMARHVAAFQDSVRDEGFHHLDVRQDHGIKGGLLESDHRDPFDRLLAAQAQIEGLTVITRDPAFVGLGCKVLW